MKKIMALILLITNHHNQRTDSDFSLCVAITSGIAVTAALNILLAIEIMRMA